MPGCC